MLVLVPMIAIVLYVVVLIRTALIDWDNEKENDYNEQY